MANFYTDTPELKFHLSSHPLMKRIVELKERGYADKVLEIIGEVCAETVAPNAEGVDHEGPKVVDGAVEYASGTRENIKAMNDAGLMGMAMPRRYGGLNFPVTPYIMAAEIVTRADAGFENIWDSRTAPRRCTNSETKTSVSVSSLVYAQGKRCPWT